MLAKRLALVGSILLGVAPVTGCKDTRECDGNCPAISDTFQITSNTVTGQCPFLPATIPPSLEIRQSPDGRTAAIIFIDPAFQLPLELTSPVFIAEDPGEELVASLFGYAYTSRPPFPDSGHIIELRYVLTASITPGHDGRREILGQLSTTSFSTASQSSSSQQDGSQICDQTISFTGVSTGLPIR